MHIKLTSSTRTQLQILGSSWRVTAMAAAMGALLSIAHVDVYALALGRITALSSLGEPLVAGIEVPDINAEEAASLKATLASPEAFRVAGMEYNPALANAQITLNKRANGSSYLLVRSDKVVTDPFLNLVVNVNWSTGRIVRSYTLLLDPPAPKQSEAVTAPIATLPTPAPVPVTLVAPEPTPAAVSTPNTAAVPAPKVMPKAAAQRANASNTGEQVKAAAGDTAGKIAANNLPANVSLDQMLVALLRGNPQAFIGNNINRLKAGAVLDLPTEAEAFAISASEARQHMVAQSKDFNNFRRKLAENAPAMASKATDRVATGKIEAKVEDKKAAVVTPDKLTLSKGGLKSDDKAAATSKENLEKIAKDRQSKDDSARAAELAKNIKDLNKIAGAAPSAATAPVAAAATAKPALPTVPVTTVPVTAAVVTAAPEVPVALAPGAPAALVAPPAPAADVTPKEAVKAPAVVAPVVVAGPVDSLMDDPIVLPAAGGLLALLLVGGLYANNKRKKRKAEEDAEDALMADNFSEKSFFSDTSNEPIMGHETPVDEPAYAPDGAVAATATVAQAVTPQPAEAGVSAHGTVVDPLTEADVYLDYGRDVQAEEILKVALNKQPENAMIYTKLLGIYAKRRDAKNFEQMALKAKLILTESDPQWTTISKQGFELEPTNPLYSAGSPELDDSFAAMTSSEFSTRTVAQLNPETAKSPTSVDLDLDFDFVSSFPTPSAPEAPKTPLMNFPDFSLEPEKTPSPVAFVAPAIATTAVVATAAAIATSVTPAAKPTAMEFDMGGLSLDLNDAAKPPVSADTGNGADVNGPLETKLALAQEFLSIGDNNGAKMLVKEVISNATGSLKQKAENLLAEMS